MNNIKLRRVPTGILSISGVKINISIFKALIYEHFGHLEVSGVQNYFCLNILFCVAQKKVIHAWLSYMNIEKNNSY